jgi:hypothetical protein
MIIILATSALDISVPVLDASTLEGQLQWFIYGFGFGSIIASLALMIRLLRGSVSGGTFEN